MPSNKHTTSSRLAYAFGAFGNDVFFATLSTYFIMFVTTHLFNSGNAAENDRMISYITLIIFLLRFVELIIDPFIGNAIDNTVTRWENSNLGLSLVAPSVRLPSSFCLPIWAALTRVTRFCTSYSLVSCISRWMSSTHLKISVFGP